MAERYSSEIIGVIKPVEWDGEATPPTLHIALYGGLYLDPDNPSSPPIHYQGCIKSDVLFKKKIGIEFWREKSGIDFGYVDIALEDQDDTYIEFGRNVTVCTVELYRVNLNTPTEEQLEILATAQCSDVGFNDEFTLRLRLESILQRGFDNPINEKYYDYTYPHLTGKPYPIAWGQWTDPYQVAPCIEVDPTILLYHVTDLVIDSFDSYVYDSGIALSDVTPANEFDPSGDHGFVLNQNPYGRITCGRVTLQDPEDTGNPMQGLFRFFRMVMTRAGIWDYANQYELMQLETDIGFGDLFPQYFTHDVVSTETFIEEILGGVTGWYYVDELSEIHFGRMVDPDDQSGVPYAFTDSEVTGKIRVEDDKAPGLTSKLSYAYNPGAYSEEEIAAGVYAQNRVDISTEFRIVVTGGFLLELQWTADQDDWTADDIIHTADGFAGFKFIAPSANVYWTRTETRKPILIHLPYFEGSPNAFDLAQQEVDRWWSELYYKRRRFYTFTVKLNDEQFNTQKIQLGDFCTLQSDRFKLLNTPKILFIRRMEQNYSKNLLTIEGWG
jgi:hypothetical protein